MKRLSRVFNVLFIVFLLLGWGTRQLSERDTKNYEELQAELWFPDVIAEVWHDNASEQIYVCYNDASYVNVYAEDGAFRWAVSTPYLRNVDFSLIDGQLRINGMSETFVYDAADGSFIERRPELPEDSVSQTRKQREPRAGDIVYGPYQVYRVQADGSKAVLVDRPAWYWLTYFKLDWLVGFVSIILYLIFWNLAERKEHPKVKPDFTDFHFQNPGMKRRVLHCMITSVLQVLYAVLEVCFGGILNVGIMIVGVHFIFSHWYTWNRRVEMTEKELYLWQRWEKIEWMTFFAAFFSVVVRTLAFGG